LALRNKWWKYRYNYWWSMWTKERAFTWHYQCCRETFK